MNTVDDENPYANPQYDDVHEDLATKEEFSAYSRKQLKKILNGMHSIEALAYLWMFLSAAFLLLIFAYPGPLDLIAALFILFLVFVLGSSVAILSHARIGKILAMIICVCMLPFIPLGTMLGVLGLAAVVQSGDHYFRKDAWSKRAIKDEIKYRKRHKLP